MPGNGSQQEKEFEMEKKVEILTLNFNSSPSWWKLEREGNDEKL